MNSLPSLLGYIDPGSGTLLVQALIAAVFGGLVVFRDAWWGLISYVLPRRRSPSPIDVDSQVGVESVSSIPHDA